MQHTYYVVSESSELQHHGIKGMHWGIRRSMEELGHYIKKRKKRKQLEKARQARAKKKKEAEEAAKRPKKLSEMTDEELAARLKRSQTEEAYLRSQSNVRNLTPAAPEKHAKLKKYYNEAIEPAMISAGKTLLTGYLEKQGKELLGINEKKAKTAYERLKEESEMANFRTNIERQKYAKDYLAKEYAQKYDKDDKNTETKKDVTFKPRTSAFGDTKTQASDYVYQFQQAAANKKFKEEASKRAAENGKQYTQLLLENNYDWLLDNKH